MSKDVRQYLKISINIGFALVVLILILCVFPKVLIFFMPFVIGWIVALIANPPVKFFEEKLKIKRKAMSAVVIILVLAGVVLLIYAIISVLIKQGMGLIESLPDKLEALETSFSQAGQKLNVVYDKLPENLQDTLDNISKNFGTMAGNLVSKISQPTVNAIGNFAMSLPNFLISTIMCILSAYFFVADRGYLNKVCKRYIPVSIQKRWEIITSSMKHAIGGYFLAQFKIEFWIYLLLITGLFILKVDYVLLVALGIAFMDLLPFFGTGTIMVPWAIIELISGNYPMTIGLLIIWSVGQVVRQIIQPKIMGDTVGMPPIPTLFLLFVGYKLGGVIGMILALPIGIIIGNLNKAGVFDTTKNSLRLLVKKVNTFRKLSSDDLKDIESDESAEMRRMTDIEISEEISNENKDQLKENQ